MCPKFLQMVKIFLNQLSKTSKKVNLEHLRLRNGDYEFKKLCFLKNNILNGELELSEQPAQFDKNTCMGDVLQRCHNVRDAGIGQNRRIIVTVIQYVQENPASICVQIRLFCRKENNEFKQVTYVRYTLDEFKELIQNLNAFSNNFNVHFSNICCVNS